MVKALAATATEHTRENVLRVSGYNALARDPEYAVKFLMEFQNRLMYGTDICNPEAAPDTRSFLLNLLNDGKLSCEAFDKIARKNACRLLGLK